MPGSSLRGLVAFIVVTAAEVLGLTAWLQLVHAGAPLLGFFALIVGEAIEWSFLAFLIARSPVSFPLRHNGVPQALLRTGLIALSEAVLWVAWLAAIQTAGFVLATLAFFVLMHFKHGVDVAVFTGRSFWGDLLVPVGIVATFFEIGGAAAWYQLTVYGEAVLGFLVLAVGISVEHFLQFKAAGLLGAPRPERADPPRPDAGTLAS